MSAPSRRTVLTASGLLAGLGVGAGAARLSREDDSEQSIVGAPGLPATLLCRNVRVSRPGTVPGAAPARGTPALPYGDLESAPGQPRGHFDTSHMTGARGAMHLHRIELDEGTLVGLGSAALDGVFTVVGAAGRFAGASGSYAVRQVDDGALEFSFDTTTEV